MRDNFKDKGEPVIYFFYIFLPIWRRGVFQVLMPRFGLYLLEQISGDVESMKLDCH